MVLQRDSTGVEGLDSLIEGGIPKGFTVVVAGNPGTGKTILASHFLYEGLTKKGENTVYISFSESKEQFYANMERLGMDFKSFEEKAKFVYFDYSSILKEEMKGALDKALATIELTKAKRLVLDSFSAISQAYQNLFDSRIVLQTILGKVIRKDRVTSLLTADVPMGVDTVGSGVEEFVSDGIIYLTQGQNSASPVTLRVLKMRGTVVNKDRHVCIIRRNGAVVYPKQSVTLTFPAPEVRVPSGVYGLDKEVEGGYLRGTVTAVIGASGVGKTTFAFNFIAEGVLNGEPGIFCSLEESVDEIKRSAQRYGFNIKELERKGLKIMSVSAEDQSPDSFIYELTAEMKKMKAKRLVVDTVTSFGHPYEDEMYVISKRLTSLARQNEVTSIFTLLVTQQPGFVVSDLGMSSLFQNMILLKYLEFEGEVKRSLIVLKMRSTQHTQLILEFQIVSNVADHVPGGIKIVGPFNYTGILTGVAHKMPTAFSNSETLISDQQLESRRVRLSEFRKQEETIAENATSEMKRRESDADTSKEDEKSWSTGHSAKKKGKGKKTTKRPGSGNKRK